MPGIGSASATAGAAQIRPRTGRIGFGAGFWLTGGPPRAEAAMRYMIIVTGTEPSRSWLELGRRRAHIG